MLRNAVYTSNQSSIHDFCTGGQLLLWGTRQWMLAYREGRHISRCVWQSFALADLHRAYAELCSILAVVAFREFPAERFRAPNRTCLSADETVFMSVFCTIEQADARQAMNTLYERASPAVARAVLGASARLIIELHRQGQRIRCRESARVPYSFQTYEPVLPANAIH